VADSSKGGLLTKEYRKVILLSIILGLIAITAMNSPRAAAYSQQEIITPELQTVFNPYDTDGNHTMDWKEGMNFYNWVESAITYRYDDENDEQGIQALYSGWITDEQLGDGRSGVDYWQKPAETYADRYGDCEDMAILELALYTYYNMTAYMGLVDVDGDGNIDHAICIVAFSEAAFQELVDQQGVVDYYELDGTKFVIVDNAYSDAYGFVGSYDPVTGYPVPNEDIDFTLYEAMTLEQVFTLERQTGGEEVPLSTIIEALVFVVLMVLPAFTYVFKKRS
jgi:hypothetical protein